MGPGLEQFRGNAKEVGGLPVGERNAILGIDQHDTFLGALERVGKARLGGAALRHFPLHHRLDVVAH
jgi:hypothetical protein